MSDNTQMFHTLNSVIKDDEISDPVRLLELIDWIRHYEKLEDKE